MVKNLPYNGGDMGLIPGRGTRIPHASEQLSSYVATTEPVHSGAQAPLLESMHCNERSARCNSDLVCHNSDPT